MSDFKLTLSEPLKTHQGEISEVAFRRPKLREIFEFGSPFRTIVGSDGKTIELVMDEDRFGKWCERLSGLSLADLGSLDAREGRRVYDWLLKELNPSGN